MKSWDDQYFRLLADSQFVLCPRGDSVWSYRFFEAILCGAIPIVEERCPAYEGFRFHGFGDPLASLEWSERHAQHNYKRCIDLLHVPLAELDAELERLLDE